MRGVQLPLVVYEVYMDKTENTEIAEASESTETVRKAPSRKKPIIITAVIMALLTAVAIALFCFEDIVNAGIPTLTIETPERLNSDNREQFTLDVTISDLGEEIYPAASLSVSFDSSSLEFLGVAEGNIRTLSDSAERALPEWSVNVERSNEIGQINVMYLDMTGGKYGFSKSLLDEKDNVLMRLVFRLRGSVRAGDVCELTVDDAVLAASDSTKSLAVLQNTLRAKNGRIAVR